MIGTCQQCVSWSAMFWHPINGNSPCSCINPDVVAWWGKTPLTEACPRFRLNEQLRLELAELEAELAELHGRT